MLPMAGSRRFHQFRPHPWHGLEVGPDPPRIVTAYIEIGPLDTVKYEIDKRSGYLKVDRPQRGAAQPPTLYGFVPRTYCGAGVAALSPAADRGDGDPLDICVVSERTVTRADILLDAHVVGGLRMIDRGEADDKIVAVLKNDMFWGEADDLGALPPRLVERMVHYFTTYKQIPGGSNVVTVASTYGREHAEKVVLASMADYVAEYGA
jgi:inorganic pyrophosphatase